MSAVSDASYSEPSEVFEDEIPSAKYVMVNTVETTRTQDTTPNIDEKVSSRFLASVIRGTQHPKTTKMLDGNSAPLFLQIDETLGILSLFEDPQGKRESF